MKRRRQWLMATFGITLVLLAAAPAVQAQTTDDPAGVVDRYATALNTHDLSAALALFDPNGSATDARGRHFEGRSGLTEFLLGNGFGAAGASLKTHQLQAFGNRALWTYSCSCAQDATDVRIVLNHNKIIVFFMLRPAPGRVANTSAGPVVWLAALALALAVALAAYRLRTWREPEPPPRPAQGRLLAGLGRARAERLVQPPS